MLKNPIRVFWTAIIVAWLFDFLFWEKSPGISFVVFVGIALSAGLILARGESEAPAWNSLWLLIPIALLALGTFLRREPLTTFTNYLLALLLMGVFAHTFRGGRWLNYSLSDYVAAFFYLTISALSKPFQALNQKRSEPDADDNPEERPPSWWKRVLPVIRGLLIAFPIVAIFAALLASADPIFADYLENLVEVFKLENLPEYVFRGIYILILGYLLAGVYIHAFTADKDQKLIGEEKAWLPAFLGFTESAIVLGSVDALFLVFVGVQFRYFFGGQTNIKIDGYTYAEYARRGFGELVWVALFSLLLFLGLSAITRRENSRQRKTFSGLGLGLVLLVGVMLVSAFQRLQLYEAAYGFTRLRTYSHIFMAWLGVLLGVVVLLELIKRQRAFALAALLCSIGFVLTLNILNVDGLITRRNVQRALQGEELDAHYLQSLSTDAIPALVAAQQNLKLDEYDRNELAAVLACQLTLSLEDRHELPWQSYHLSAARAWDLLQANKGNFSAAQVYQNEWDWWVLVNGEHRPCSYDPYAYY